MCVHMRYACLASSNIKGNMCTMGLIGWLPKLWHAKIWALPILEPPLSLVPKNTHISHLFYQNGGKVFCLDFDLPKLWHANFLATNQLDPISLES